MTADDSPAIGGAPGGGSSGSGSPSGGRPGVGNVPDGAPGGGSSGGGNVADGARSGSNSGGGNPGAGVALAVRNLSVAYGNVVAVHDATFTVAEGDACAIIGPNGNGKSSILMGVTGMIRRRGTVEIFGAPARNGDVRWAAQARPDPRARTPPALPRPVHGRQHPARLLHVDEEYRQGAKIGTVRPRD